jgi:hypothetical protein
MHTPENLFIDTLIDCRHSRRGSIFIRLDFASVHSGVAYISNTIGNRVSSGERGAAKALKALYGRAVAALTTAPALKRHGQLRRAG